MSKSNLPSIAVDALDTATGGLGEKPAYCKDPEMMRTRWECFSSPGRLAVDFLTRDLDKRK